MNVTVTLQLPAEIIRHYEEQAEAEQRTLAEVLQETLVSAVDEEDWEETPDEEILADLRQSLEDLKAGRLIDAHEALKELKKQHGIQG